MVIREVPAVGRWSLILGLVLPFFGYALLADYNPSQSFLWNAQVQHIVLPFFHGTNPLTCLADSTRKLATVPFGWSYKPEPGCLYNTTIAFSNVLILSLFFLVIGLSYYVRKQELANLWPTDMTLHEDDDDKKSAGGSDKKKIKVDYDGPIPPNQGGF